MKSDRPYLIRALNEWILDNDLTPHILVDANADDVKVPSQFITDGKVVLNIAPGAVKALQIDNNHIVFNARFSGKSHHISIPVGAVLAIYAKENGKGMIFPVEAAAEEKVQVQDSPGPPKKPHLKIVK